MAVVSSASFGVWWHNIGSGIVPLATEDQEEHARRVCTAAWNAATLPPDNGDDSLCNVRRLRLENERLRATLTKAEREFVRLFTELPIKGPLPSPSVMQDCQWALSLPNAGDVARAGNGAAPKE